MNKKLIIIVVLALLAAMTFVLFFGGQKETVAESVTDELQTETEAVTEITNGAADTIESTGANVDVTVEATEAAVAGNASAKDATEAVEESKQTEPPIDENGNVSDVFIDENVNLGVEKGDGSGGDIIVDDSNPPAQPQPTKPVVPAENAGGETVTLTVPITEITFDIYNAMSAAEQQAVIDTFGSMEDFVVWFNYIKAQYETEHPDIEIGSDGVVNLN